jgi:hypothetical protein
MNSMCGLWMIRVINVRSDGSPFLDDMAQREDKNPPPHTHTRSRKDSNFYIYVIFFKRNSDFIFHTMSVCPLHSNRDKLPCLQLDEKDVCFPPFIEAHMYREVTLDSLTVCREVTKSLYH